MMSTWFERGERYVIEQLEEWQRAGMTLQEACKVIGAEYLETLRSLRRHQTEDHRPETHRMIEINIEFYEGMLSHLD